MSERFPISPAAMDACAEIVRPWRDTHYPDMDIEEQLRMMASRVNSWVSGASVVEGVRDIMVSVVRGEGSLVKIEELGIKLGRKLTEEGLLIASPRRGASLG